MKTIRFPLIALLVVSPFFAFSQFNETIVSGRPGFSNGPFSIGKNVYQIQSGLTVNEEFYVLYDTPDFVREDKTFERERLIINERIASSVIRIGILEKTELRVGYNYQKNTFLLNNADLGRFQERIKTDESDGLSKVAIGVRQNFSAQRNFIPAIGLQFTTTFDFEATEQSEILAYQLRLLLQHKIIDKLVLNTNLTTSIEDSNFDYLFSLSYAISKKFRTVAEFYGTKFNDDLWRGNTTTKSANLGVGYLFNNNFQLDLFGGRGIGEDDYKTYFVSTGFSYRLNRRK